MRLLNVILGLLIFWAQNISANEQISLTEAPESTSSYSFGVGISMMTINDYIGADESQFYIFPTPYIFYQSDTLIIDQNAFTGELFESKRWHLAVDAAGSIPVNSDKNAARLGMTDLDWVGELGPSLEYYFAGDSRSKNRTYVDFSIRKAINTDFKQISDTGWTGQVSLNNKYQFKTSLLGGETILDSTVALLFHSDKYAQYFYSVTEAEANATRTEYNAQGGYAGARLSLGGTWRSGNVWIGVFTRYTYLSKTSFVDSPLVKSTSNLLIGMSVSYIFKERK